MDGTSRPPVRHIILISMPNNRKKQKHDQDPSIESLSETLVVLKARDDGDEQVILENYPKILKDTLMDPYTFLSKYFRKSAVCRRGSEDRVSRIKEMLFDLDPKLILQETSSDNIFIWLRNKDTGLINSIEVSDPNAELALYHAGHATYCRAPPELEQTLVSAILEETGLGCGQYDPTGESMTTMGRGEVEVFQSTEDHTTQWHFDFQENFTIQVSGKKRWTLQHGTVKHPLRGCTPHYQSPDAVEPQLKAARLADPTFVFDHPNKSNARGPVETIELSPGDTFYFPAGMWHKVETVEPGVSINISLMATNYANLICQSLEHVLLQRDEFRECVTLGTPNQDHIIDKLEGLLKALPGIINEFREKGGSRMLVPPCLQHGKPVAFSNDEMDEDHSDEEIEADSESFLSAPDGFDPFLGKAPLAKLDLTRNPLAMLIPDEDVHEFYAENGCKYKTIYSLHVNYAGNEMHESSIKGKVRDPSMFLVRHGVNKDIRVDCLNSLRGGERELLMALIYYGYYVQK